MRRVRLRLRHVALLRALLTALPLLLTGCSERHVYTLRGESLNWSAAILDQTETDWRDPHYHSWEQGTISVTFKGAPATLGKVAYHYTFAPYGGEGGGEADFHHQPHAPLLFQSGFGSGGTGGAAPLPANTTVKIIVTWDGQSETFTLRP